MHPVPVLLVLAASGVTATAVLAQRATSLVGRDVSQGWSLQADGTLPGTIACGNGAYCPSSLHCNPAANHEVAACCTGSSDCRGDVEGAPKCADSTWDLWIGYDGNGFCCESDMVGAYDISQSVAGTCVASGSVGSLRTAVLTSTGSGSVAVTSAASSDVSTSTSFAVSAASSASSVGSIGSDVTSSASSVMSSASIALTASAASPSASSTGSATSSSASTKSTANTGDKLGISFRIIGAAILAAGAL